MATPTAATPPPPPPSETSLDPMFNASCNGLMCTFDARATQSNRADLTFVWAFGDGTSYVSPFTQHTYAALGTYQVVVRVTASDGTSAVAMRSVEVTDWVARGKAPPVPAGSPAATQGITIDVRHEWQFDGRAWTWSYSIDRDSYLAYKERDRSRYSEKLSAFVLDPTDDKWVDSLAQALLRAADEKGWSRAKIAEFTLAFVQSLPYSFDNETTRFDDYPRFPIETLAEFTGDCEDTSILYASLLHEMGYHVVLLNPPGHVAVGVAGAGFHGSYWTSNGDKFYYAETTGQGFTIGEVPADYVDAKARVIEINDEPILSELDWKASPELTGYRIRVNVTNVGSRVARDITLGGAYEAGNEQYWHDTSCELIDVSPFGYAYCEFTLPGMTRGTRTRLFVYAFNEEVVSTGHSEWFTF